MAQYTTIRTNTLGLATGTLNMGLDIAITKKLSIDVSGYWNPISVPGLRLRTLGAFIGIRRWRFEPHVGFFWGMHFFCARYRVGNRYTRYNGYLLGPGVSAGYSWMWSRRWNFSLEGGVGIFYMNDTKWYPDTSPLDNNIVMKHYHRFVLAPSKLEISFSYLF